MRCRFAGTHHKLWWKCFDRQCESNNGKSPFCRNLLGLVRGLVDGQHLGTAISVISKFLGFEGRSWDITNGKYKSERGPAPERNPQDDEPPF